MGINASTIFEFVEQISDRYPNLVDFLGFTEDGDVLGDMEIENTGDLTYEEHFSPDEINEKLK